MKKNSKRPKYSSVKDRDAKLFKVDTSITAGVNLVPEGISSVLLSLRDKANGIEISTDQLNCSGCIGGYRMVRATHGVHSGSYYFEAVVLDSSRPNSHFRVGWASREAELAGPVGYDKYSFSYRDLNGSIVHNSIRDDSYSESFGPNDVVGCYIKLDEHNSLNNEIRFFKNGKDQGVAFSGSIIPTTIYFPAISIFMQGEIAVNFGPSFIYRNDIYGANPVSEIQPMNPAERKVHEIRIQQLKKTITEKEISVEEKVS